MDMRCPAYANVKAACDFFEPSAPHLGEDGCVHQLALHSCSQEPLDNNKHNNTTSSDTIASITC